MNTTDPDQVLEAWVKDISRSRAEEKPSVAEANCDLPHLVSESYANLEMIHLKKTKLSFESQES